MVSRKLRWLWASLCVVSLVGACGSSEDDLAKPGSRVCTPGATQVCVGNGACQGGQVCNAQGTAWGECVCGSGTGGSAGSSGGAAGGGGSGGGGSGGASGGTAGSTSSGGVGGAAGSAAAGGTSGAGGSTLPCPTGAYTDCVGDCNPADVCATWEYECHDPGHRGLPVPPPPGGTLRVAVRHDPLVDGGVGCNCGSHESAALFEFYALQPGRYMFQTEDPWKVNKLATECEGNLNCVTIGNFSSVVVYTNDPTAPPSHVKVTAVPPGTPLECP